jgi:CheY-like chemotaxis protein
MNAPLRKILHVEDDVSLQRLVRVVLEQIGGYAVETVGDGVRALEAARQAVPHLVLLDLDLPGMSGLSVLREMRATEALRTVPVVFLTAAADPRLMDESRALGVSEMLAKPFRPRLLVQSIEQVLARHAHGG